MGVGISTLEGPTNHRSQCPGSDPIVVQGPAPGWPGGPPLHVMMLNAEPCKLYYINAQFDTTITQQWTPVIDYVEQIAGCQVPAAK